LLAAASVVGKLDRQSQKRRRQSSGIKIWAGFAPLRGAVGELGGDASSPSSACIGFQDWRALAKLVLILAEQISSTFVPRGFAALYTISRSTESQSLPHRVNCNVCVTLRHEFGPLKFHRYEFGPPKFFPKTWFLGFLSFSSPHTLIRNHGRTVMFGRYVRKEPTKERFLSFFFPGHSPHPFYFHQRVSLKNSYS